MIRPTISILKTYINKVPHWVIVLVVSSLGAADGYLRQQASGTILAAAAHWSTLWPILREAGVVGLTTFFAMLRREPWLEILGGTDASGGSGLLPPIPSAPATLPTGTSPPAPADKLDAYIAVCLTLFVYLAIAACGGQVPTAAPVEFSGAIDACQRYSTGMAQYQRCRAETLDTWCGDSGLMTHADGGQCAAVGAP